VQAESEVSAINMVLGAAACGIPALTSSSSCGISLMQEGISYMAGSQIPGVIVNMQRGGPGLGDIGPSQGDYFQAVKGGGHGDHRNLVIAPSTAQECYDFMFRAFALAFKYANPVMVLGDAIVGQIKEPVRRVPPKDAVPAEDLAALAAPWRMEGFGRRGPNAAPRLLKSVYLAEGALAERNRMLMRKYESMKADCAFECVDTDDAELIVVAFGSIARIARSAIRQLRAEGHKVGLFRPITLFPFPEEALRALAPGTAFSGYGAEHGADGGRRSPVPFRPAGGIARIRAVARRYAGAVHRRRCPARPHAAGPQGELIMQAQELDALRPAEGESLVFDTNPVLNERPTHYCPGCHHGIAHRLVTEVLHELGVAERTILVASVGCATFTYDYFNVDGLEAPHGRACAVATGVRRARPDSVVFTYQGDGDMAAIGMAESLHAANRGEKDHRRLHQQHGVRHDRRSDGPHHAGGAKDHHFAAGALGQQRGRAYPHGRNYGPAGRCGILRPLLAGFGQARARVQKGVAQGL